MTDESISELYFRIGLDIADLKSGFVDAENTLTSELKKLERQTQALSLQAQIELTGLDEAALETDGLRIRQEALTRQIEIQQDRIQLVSAAYMEMCDAQGENSAMAQELQVQLAREELAMKRLEEQTRSLVEQQRIAIGVNWEMLGAAEPVSKFVDTLANGADTMSVFGRSFATSHVKAFSMALVGLSAVIAGTIEATNELAESNSAEILGEDFQHAESDVGGALNQVQSNALRTAEVTRAAFQDSAKNVSSSLQEESAGFMDYLKDSLRMIQILTADSESLSDALQNINSNSLFMKTKAGEYGALGAGIFKSLQAASDEAIEFARPAIDGFGELKDASDELNISLSKTSDFTNLIKLAGAEYDDVRDYVRGVQDAIIKGEVDDPEAIALNKYGVEIQNANGTLLAFDETLERLYQGYLKAREAGEAEAYVIMTNGQSVQDVLPFFERLAEAEETFGKIQWSTADFAGLDEASTNLKLMETQLDELKNSLSTLSAPLASFAAESSFNTYRELTQIIEENRDTILYWEFAFVNAFEKAKNFGSESADKIIDKVKSLNEAFGITDKVKNFFSGFETEGGILSDLFGDVLNDAQEDLDAYIKANEKSRAETEKTAEEITAGLSYSYNRIAKFKDELAAIKIDLKFGGDDYKKRLAELDQWREESMRNARYYKEEQAIIEELYNAKLEQIERDHNEEIERARKETEERIQELMQGAADIEYAATHSAIEKQIRDIELWKEEKLGALKDTENAQQEALAIAVNAYAREREAFEREIDRIKGKTQDLHEKIFEQEHSQRDVDVLRAQKERAQLYQEGIYDPETIERWYQNELGKIAERATESFRTNQGAYSQAPRRRGGNDGFQLIEGGDVTGGAPPPDFYGEIQAQTDKAMERFGVLADSTQAVTDAQSNFADVLARESERFAQVMQELSEKLLGSQFAADKADNQIAATNQPAEDPLLNSTNAKTFFNVLANGGEIAALAGLATANPALGLGGAATAAVGNVGSTAVDAWKDYGKNQPELPTAPSADLSEFNSLIQGFQDEMSRLIGDLYETTKGIAENVNKISSQPPNITVSPTINVDLGGAYVFDNTMKAQLTEDITDKVADAVKSAVENGISQSSYGYGS